jgi:hypothetical protein
MDMERPAYVRAFFCAWAKASRKGEHFWLHSFGVYDYFLAGENHSYCWSLRSESPHRDHEEKYEN